MCINVVVGQCLLRYAPHFTLGMLQLSGHPTATASRSGLPDAISLLQLYHAFIGYIVEAAVVCSYSFGKYPPAPCLLPCPSHRTTPFPYIGGRNQVQLCAVYKCALCKSGPFCFASLYTLPPRTSF